jgi:1-deoxy-D-xylulose-5-phosphate reductoisomerase
MVMAGDIVTKRARENGVKILPVDSEHSAIFQCMQGQRRENVRKLILTASGGPFLNLNKSELKKVTPGQALKHPKWKMGKKITIDCASMMNKGLEVIEARWLFDLPIDRIEVLIHPQSIVHSMVELIDGSVLAQMGIADMRLPIAYALTYPERIENNLPALNLAGMAKLEFQKPDVKKFPCLRLACEAGISGGTMPAVLNAANEEAVTAFINGMIRFTDLPVIINKVLDIHDSRNNPSLEDILRADEWARLKAKGLIERIES